MKDFRSPNESELKIFGRHLARLRKQKGWSQERLSLESGLARSYLGGIERGSRNLSLVNILKLAQTLSIPAADLLLENGADHAPSATKPKIKEDQCDYQSHFLGNLPPSSSNSTNFVDASFHAHITPPETEGGGHIEARKLPGPTDAHTQADGAGLSNLGECSRSDCPFRSAQIEK
jgi:transcriptional regulator with XRE-family HTH domain